MSDKPEKIYLSDMGVTMINSGEGVSVGTVPDSWLKNEYLRADLAKPSEWISCADRLPEDSGYYMVGHPDGLVTMLPWNPIDGWHNASLDDEGYWNQRITHYQPLPSPPTRETP